MAFLNVFFFFFQPVASKITITMYENVSLSSVISPKPFTICDLLSSAFYLLLQREGSHHVVCTVPGAMGS